MWRMLFLSVTLLTLYGVAFAEAWPGRLIDEDCFKERRQSAGCDASKTTTWFALEVSGKIYKLDPAGSFKASVAIRESLAGANDSTKAQSKEVRAKVSGKKQGDTITVESIQVD